MRGTESKGTAYFHRLMLNPSCLVAAKNVKFLGSCLIVLQALIGLNTLNASIDLKGLRSDGVDVVTHNSFVTKAAHIIDCIETNGIGPGCRIDIRLGRWNMPGMPTNPAFAQIQSANWVDPTDPSQGVRVVNVDGSISILSAQDFSNSFHMDSASGTYQLLGSSSGQDYALTNNNTDLLSGYGRSRSSGRDSENSDSWQSGSSDVSSIESTPRFLDEDKITFADQQAKIIAAKKAAFVAKRFGKEEATGTPTVADAPPSSSNRAPASIDGTGGGGGTSTDTPDSLHRLSEGGITTKEKVETATTTPTTPAPAKAKASVPPTTPQVQATTTPPPAPKVTTPATAPATTPTTTADAPKTTAPKVSDASINSDPFAFTSDTNATRRTLSNILNTNIDSLAQVPTFIESGKLDMNTYINSLDIDSFCTPINNFLGKVLDLNSVAPTFKENIILAESNKCEALSAKLIEITRSSLTSNTQPIIPLKNCLMASDSPFMIKKNADDKRTASQIIDKMNINPDAPSDFACDALGIINPNSRSSSSPAGHLANN